MRSVGAAGHAHGPQPIAFGSGGVTLRGLLYRPEPAIATGAAVVMAHGFSATITMAADRYAEVFASAGLTVVLYDHRGFGVSDGDPRFEINPWVQARGYRDALTFAAGIPGVDPSRVALWGDSLSGAEAFVVAGVDERAAAVVAQVPATGAAPPPADQDGRLYDALRQTLLAGDVTDAPCDVDGPLPVVSSDQLNAPSLLTPIQAYRWFIDYGGRFASRWENRAIRVTPQTPAPFHAGIAAPHVHCPALVQIAPDDEMLGADPAIARAVAHAIAGPTEIVDIEGGHFGLLYHPSPTFDTVSRDQVAFLLRTLTGTAHLSPAALDEET